jgi:signal transduction histidine kinase/integral membrane sensor domain MASE1
MELRMPVGRWRSEVGPAVSSLTRESGSAFVERISFYVIVALAYFIGAKVGLILTIQPLQLSTLWPPNAIVLAALLLSPRRSWLPLIACLLPVHMAVELLDGVPLPMALFWFVTNMAEALIGAVSIRHFVNGYPRFNQLRDTTVFLIFGVMFAPFVSSFFDVAAVKLNNWSEGDFWTLWSTRFFSNAVAILVLTPAIITAVERISKRASIRNNNKIEATILIFSLVGVCATIFMMSGENKKLPPFVLFTLFPLMIWSAIRFGSGFVSYLMLIIISFAIWGAQHWAGPLVNGAVLENVMAIQIFSLLTGMPLVLLSAAICELRVAEKSTRTSKQQLHLALIAAQLDTWTWEFDSNIVSWSGSAGSDAYDNDHQIADIQFFQRVHTDDREKIKEALRAAANQGKPYDLEIRMDYGNGDYHWYNSRGFPQLDEKGRIFGLIGINVDINRRKQEAVQMQLQRDELAHLSRVAMLGEMSGAIAHELNQPLTAILSNAQAAQRLQLRSAAPSIGLLEILEDIISENKRAGEIIQRMRELLKKGQVKLQQIDINSIIPKVLALQHSDLVCRNVAIKTQLEPSLPPALADSVQVQQVLLNLIINACDAMQNNVSQERLIRITTSWDKAKWLEIAVSDRGKGVPTDNLEKIFEPFVSTKTEGLGLGLTICRSIVTAHGGKLWATNNPEIGATFHFVLPVSELQTNLGDWS